MAGERRLRILTQLSARPDGQLGTRRLCEVCAEVTGMSGAGIMLMFGDLPHGSICTSDTVSATLEELQYTLGEGPCLDAYREGQSVFEADLARQSTPRWPAFTNSALEAGARAIFGFPLQVGAVRLGALNLYRDQAGALSDEQHADALVMAEVAAEAVLVLQAGASPEKVAAELEAGGDFHYVVHQAAGMVAAQLDVSVGQALVRLRGYAFRTDQRLAEVADDVVARRLRFDQADGKPKLGP